MSRRGASAVLLWTGAAALIAVAVTTYWGQSCDVGAGLYPWEIVGAGILIVAATYVTIPAGPVIAIILSIALGSVVTGILLFIGAGHWVGKCTA